MSSPMPTEASQLRERTYEELQRLLLSGEFPVGTPLTEMKLADRLGVSRTPVREALTRLADDGLVDTRPSGTRVVADLGKKVAEVLQIRVQLEPFAAGLAANRVNTDDLNALGEIQDRIEMLMKDWDSHVEELLRLNRQFHRQIVGHCGNASLVDVLDRLSPFAVFPRTLTLYTEAQRIQAFAEHRDILDALWKRDPAGAEAITRTHLMRGATAIRKAIG